MKDAGTGTTALALSKQVRLTGHISIVAGIIPIYGGFNYCTWIILGGYIIYHISQ